MSKSNAANWVLSKRFFHWALSLAVLVALLSPKPEDGEGLLHIIAGTSALALVLVRLGWRIIGDVRPYVKDAWRLTPPDVSKGARGFAPALIESARICGFLFLALIPIAVALALAGIGQGEETPLLEAHEAAGTFIMALAIIHALAVILFTLIIKYDLFGITFWGSARSFSEGGRRGVMGMVLGAGLGLGLLVYVWGPFDLASKASTLMQNEQDGHGYERDE